MMRTLTKLMLVTLATLAFGQIGPREKLIGQNDKANEGPKAPQAFSEAILEGPTVEDMLAEQAQTFDFLVSERVGGVVGSQIVVEPSQEQLDSIANYNCPDCGNGGKKMMVGVNLPADIAVDFNGLNTVSRSPQPFQNGMIQGGEKDGFVWTSNVESVGANAIRIHFDNVKLVGNDQIFVYNDLGEVAGPYGRHDTVNGQLWSAAISGPVVSVQLHHGGGPATGTGAASQFVIKQIAHIGDDFLIPGLLNGNQFESFCSFNASCVVDAQCHQSVSAVQDARQGVAHILFTSGSGQFICSGGLLNDTDASTTIPYFLTANHCISTGSEAASTQFYWQFRTSSCTTSGTCPSRTTAASTSGASLLRTGSTSDYTLMQCNQTPPAGSILLGWNATAVANSHNTPLYRISHPKGAPQAYSQHNVSTTKGTCTSWPRGPWIYEQDITGATEGGSSGSPVVNASGQVVGQLSGACGTNPSNPCASSSNATVDGAFANYFSNVDDLLDPSTGGGGCNNNGFNGTAGPLSGTSSFWGSSFQYFTVSVPSNTCQLVVSISGGTGDADLYTRFGANPTTSTYACRPYLAGNNETCTHNNPQAGTWHIGINAYSNYSGVTLTATH